MRRLNAIGTVTAGAALVAVLAPAPAHAALNAPQAFHSSPTAEEPAIVHAGTPAATGARAVVRARRVEGSGAVAERSVGRAGQADLGVRIAAGPSGRVRLGGLLDYTIKVGNAGPEVATGVRVVVSLPAGLAVIGTTPGACAERGLRIACDFAELGSGASAEISIGTVVTGDAAGDLRTRVRATSDTADPTTADNEATSTVRVEPGTGLVVKLSAPERAEAGGVFTMRATVINRGPLKATKVRLEVGIEHSRFRTLGERCARERRTRSRCDLGALEVGATTTLAFQVQIADTATGTLGNFAATASADMGDTHPADNVANALVKVRTSMVATGGMLPVSGFDPVPTGTLAVLLLAVGGLLTAASRPRRERPGIRE
ncbi:MAG: DUF11 domain-containing protein [Streptosporangiaceae bacterium]